MSEINLDVYVYENMEQVLRASDQLQIVDAQGRLQLQVRVLN